MLNEALRFLLNIVCGLLVYSVLLRFMMQWLRAPFRNPLGQAVTVLTDWAVKPLRRVIPGYRGYDWASLLLAWFFQ
ncbi:MAG TPA: YggT family protein, partial [Casimicrobiaceae bacterium]